MEVIYAKSAGFCFGVDRAIRILEEQLQAGARIVTLGEIIHNPQMVEYFRQRGVRAVSEPKEVPEGFTAVIRSHGVSPEVTDYFEKNNIPYIDATCVYVSKIHRIVREAGESGKIVVIAGDENHPEVRAILGHCVAEKYVVSDSRALEKLFSEKKELLSGQREWIFLSQTTFSSAEWKKCTEISKKVCTRQTIFDTICNATMLRQCEAEKISRTVSHMLVIGGRESSNTAKLAEICSVNCPTDLLETASELDLLRLRGLARIGVTAGASTPAFIIKEVQTAMSEMQNLSEEMSFEEMLDQSFKTIHTREKVKAIVTGVAPNEISVDVGTKHAGYVPLAEFTNDSTADLRELVRVGDEIELVVLHVNDAEGTAMLSKRRIDSERDFDRIVNAQKTGEILEGKVTDVINDVSGIIVLSGSMKIFVPASQASATRGVDLQTLLKTQVQFKILETDDRRNRAVGSIRAVQEDQRKLLEGKFWEEAAAGKVYKGTVKSITTYGAFVDLGGVDGMVHISQLSWSRIKHPTDVVNIGDNIEVYIIQLDREKRKISLGYRRNEDNPWEQFRTDYNVGDTVTATIVSMTPFGAFAEVMKNVDGLIHISQITKERIKRPNDVLEVGQTVDAKITELDFENRKLSLSMKALLPPDPDENPQESDSAPLTFEVGPGFVPDYNALNDDDSQSSGK